MTKSLIILFNFIILNVIIIIGLLLLFTGVYSLFTRLFKPQSTIGGFIYTTIGFFVVFKHSKLFRNFIFSRLSKQTIDLLFHKSILDILTEPSTVYKVYIFVALSTVLPKEDMLVVMNSLPNQLNFFQNNGLVSLLPQSIRDVIIDEDTTTNSLPTDPFDRLDEIIRIPNDTLINSHVNVTNIRNHGSNNDFYRTIYNVFKHKVYRILIDFKSTTINRLTNIFMLTFSGNTISSSNLFACMITSSVITTSINSLDKSLPTTNQIIKSLVKFLRLSSLSMLTISSVLLVNKCLYNQSNTIVQYISYINNLTNQQKRLLLGTIRCRALFISTIVLSYYSIRYNIQLNSIDWIYRIIVRKMISLYNRNIQSCKDYIVNTLTSV